MRRLTIGSLRQGSARLQVILMSMILEIISVSFKIRTNLCCAVINTEVIDPNKVGLAQEEELR
jgi:hypothetical protein